MIKQLSEKARSFVAGCLHYTGNLTDNAEGYEHLHLLRSRLLDGLSEAKRRSIISEAVKMWSYDDIMVRRDAQVIVMGDGEYWVEAWVLIMPETEGAKNEQQ